MAEQDRIGEIRARLAAATPGEWAWNSYSGIVAIDLIRAWDDHEGYPEGTRPGIGTAEDRAYLRQRDAAYDADPSVAWVPAHYGDTATGRHANDANFIAHAPADLAHLLAEVERLQGERDEYAEAVQSVSDDRESRLKTARRDVTNVCKAATEYRRERDQFAARLAASERQRQALVEAGEVAERVKVASVTVLECIDDPLFLSAEALKNSPHVAELRAALAAAATPEGE